MKKLLTLSAITLALMMTGTPALADGYRHHDRGGYEHYRDRHDHRDHHYRHPGKHHGWNKRDRRVVRYSRDHRGHYYADVHGHYVIHNDRGHDYYKWIGGAIILGEILHHSHQH